MDTAQALALLPAVVRKRIYIGLGCVASLLSAVVAFFLASPLTVPWWIPAGLAGIGSLAGPFGILAGGNVTPDPQRAARDETGQIVFADPE